MTGALFLFRYIGGERGVLTVAYPSIGNGTMHCFSFRQCLKFPQQWCELHPIYPRMFSSLVPIFNLSDLKCIQMCVEGQGHRLPQLYARAGVSLPVRYNLFTTRS